MKKNDKFKSNIIELLKKDNAFVVIKLSLNNDIKEVFIKFGKDKNNLEERKIPAKRFSKIFKSLKLMAHPKHDVEYLKNSKVYWATPTPLTFE